MDLTLPEAWALWMSGEQLTEYAINGFPMVWIGRWGKLLSFVSGLVIVLDLLNLARIRAWERRYTKSQCH